MGIKRVDVKRFRNVYTIGEIFIEDRSASVEFAFSDKHLVNRWLVPGRHLTGFVSKVTSGFIAWDFSIAKGEENSRFELRASVIGGLSATEGPVTKDWAETMFEPIFEKLGSMTEVDYVDFLKRNPTYINSASGVFINTIFDSFVDSFALRQRFEQARAKGIRI